MRFFQRLQISRLYKKIVVYIGDPEILTLLAAQIQKKSFQESVRKKAAEAEDAIQKLDVNAATAEQAEVIQEQAVTEEDKFFKFIASSTVDFTLAAKLADLEEIGRAHV